MWDNGIRVRISTLLKATPLTVEQMLGEDEMLEYQSLHLDPAVDKDASFQLWQTREYRSR